MKEKPKKIFWFYRESAKCFAECTPEHILIQAENFKRALGIFLQERGTKIRGRSLTTLNPKTPKAFYKTQIERCKKINGRSTLRPLAMFDELVPPNRSAELFCTFKDGMWFVGELEIKEGIFFNVVENFSSHFTGL
ncbi:MAG: hypothetical protein CEO19_163 [Parcubacteria group bacterium Gr01-1014_73]|nr:MAG: hypothetical protein CEO19_163 [Parcubacteria group bacterium Gr01-1014_73]